MEVYDPATNSWSTAAPLPLARSALAAATSDDQILAVGRAASFGVVAALAIGVPEVRWTSQDSTIATIDAGGAATGLGNGTTPIIASSAVAQGNATLTVGPPRQQPVFTGLSAPANGYGTVSASIGGVISAGTSIPSGSVNVTLNGVTQTVGIDANGKFAATFATQGLPVAGSPYAILFSDAGNDAFAPASGRSTLTVTPALLAITADDRTKAVGDPPPVFTATYSGFVNGENPTFLGGTLFFSTAASATSPAGSYQIYPAGLLDELRHPVCARDAGCDEGESTSRHTDPQPVGSLAAEREDGEDRAYPQDQRRGRSRHGLAAQGDEQRTGSVGQVDWVATGTDAIQLRAERDPHGNGRIYTDHLRREGPSRKLGHGKRHGHGAEKPWASGMMMRVVVIGAGTGIKTGRGIEIDHGGDSLERGKRGSSPCNDTTAPGVTRGPWCLQMPTRLSGESIHPSEMISVQPYGSGASPSWMAVRRLYSSPVIGPAFPSLV
jgi:hypothetical protein